MLTKSVPSASISKSFAATILCADVEKLITISAAACIIIEWAFDDNSVLTVAPPEAAREIRLFTVQIPAVVVFNASAAVYLCIHWD